MIPYADELNDINDLKWLKGYVSLVSNQSPLSR